MIHPMRISVCSLPVVSRRAGWPAARGLLAWLAGVVLLAGLAGCASLGSYPPQAGARRGEAGEPVVVLVSLDGFRWDYLWRFSPPNLRRLAAEGVRAERLVPVFPSSTFANHYSIVTGLWPEHHGIVANRFIAPELDLTFEYGKPQPEADACWGGEPIWVTAVKQGARSASVFWPGSDAQIEGTRPTYWLPYDQAMPAGARVDQVLGWLALPPAERPSVITLYFHHTDSAAHTFGVGSDELREAITKVDDAVGQLRAGIERLGLQRDVHLVIVSDHGMTTIDPKRRVALDDFVKPDEEVKVSFCGPVTALWPVPPLTADDVMERFRGREKYFRAYRREELPERWHLRDQERMGEVVLVAELGASVLPRSVLESPIQPLEVAGHGFDNTENEMGATFIAWGPLYRQRATLSPVENIHVYRLLCATVGLEPAPGDGDDSLARAVLTPAAWHARSLSRQH